MLDAGNKSASFIDPVSVAKKAYQAYVDKDRALIELLVADNFHFTSPTIRDGKLVEGEVYFGWSLPHEAPAGGFTTSNT